MKKDSYTKKGFTLIEVLISLVILTIITIITSSFLQSSIQSKEIVFSKSSQTLQINLLGDIIRDDIANAINTPLIDIRGDPQSQTFQSNLNTNSFKFVTKVKAGQNITSSLVQVEYLLDRNQFLRRQFYASAPSNNDDFLETILLKDITNIELEFSDEDSWSYFWPVNSAIQNKFPTLIKIVLEQDKRRSFTWIINSNLHNTYE